MSGALSYLNSLGNKHETVLLFPSGSTFRQALWDLSHPALLTA